MLGDVNSPNKVPAGQSCIFRVTDSNWDGKLPNSYSVCARLRSGNSGSYDLWIFSDGENLWFFRAGDAGFPQSADDFVKVANAMPPQEYALPLAGGASPVGAGYKNTYSKDQFGIVRVWFSIHFETLPAINQIVFQLPAGFKPSAMCCGSAYLSMGAYYPASINIDANGNGFVGYGSITHSGAINMHGFIEFPAVN